MSEKRFLLTLGEGNDDIPEKLAKQFESTASFQLNRGERTRHVEPANILFVDAVAYSETDILDNANVQDALDHGIPIVIKEPNSNLLASLAGVGADLPAAIVVRGMDSSAFVWAFEDPKSATVQHESFTKVDTTRQQQDAPDSSSPTEPVSSQPPQTVAPPEQINIHSWTESDNLADVIVSVLEDIDAMEGRLLGLHDRANDGWGNLPAHRKWLTAIDFGWTQMQVGDDGLDGSVGGGRKQHARFHVYPTFKLVAVDSPKKGKLFNVAVQGTGFEPKSSNENFVSDHDTHRGFFNALTLVEYSPDMGFGRVLDYVPENQTESTSVSAGYEWGFKLGGTGGGNAEGPSGELNVEFSYSRSHSVTKESKHFKTETRSVGENGMKFYHNVYTVGDRNPQLDAVAMFEQGWNGEKEKLFYWAFPRGYLTHDWGSLSKQLIKPYNECIWLTESNITSTHSFRVTVEHGVYQVNSWFDKMRFVNWRNRTDRTLQVDFSRVSFKKPS